MLLAIDIGNTNIGLGIFRGKELVASWKLLTGSRKTVDEYCIILRELFDSVKIHLESIDGIIICSVVPKVLTILKEVLKRLTDLKPMIVGEDIDSGIKNLYNDPAQVGQDRLVNALSAYRLYGGPLIIVDFGTAITFDLVSGQGEYLGGIIVPGIEISLQALSEKAALLPEVEISRPKALLGKDTVNSMWSGAIYGFSALTDGLVNKLKKEFGQNIRVVATGGAAEIISGYCETIGEVNPQLTLEGLRITYESQIPPHPDTS